jgi:IS5 family transposase
MACLLYLKHAFNVSDEELVERWSENVVRQYFSGLEHCTPKLPCDAAQIGRFRTAIGEAGVEALLKASIDAAVEMEAIRASECERVIVGTTAQEKRLPIRSIAGCWKWRAPRWWKRPGRRAFV